MTLLLSLEVNFIFSYDLICPFCTSSSFTLAILRAGAVIRDEVGLSLDKADKDVLGTAAKVVVTKDSTTIVGDGTTQEEVNKRVTQIKNQIEVCILEDCKFCVPLLF